MILVLLGVVFLGTIIIGFPLVWAVMISTLLPMFAFSRPYPLEAVFLNFIAGVEPNIYIAIPLFILAGQLLNHGGMGARIIRFVRSLLGFLPGGLGICVVAASMIFGGISGSAIADAAAVGSVMIPSMAQRGYRKPFAAALVAAAGTIGIIVPPSIPLLVYGFVGNVSVKELFIAVSFLGRFLLCALWPWPSGREGRQVAIVEESVPRLKKSGQALLAARPPCSCRSLFLVVSFPESPHRLKPPDWPWFTGCSLPQWSIVIFPGSKCPNLSPTLLSSVPWS